MIVADTGAVLGLLDRSDRHHDALRRLFEAEPDAWVLPWAVLPEVDYLVATRLGARAQRVWLDDVASGAFAVQWGTDEDLTAARALTRQYEALDMGLVDAVVMAIAVRLGADIATLDLRHFGAVRLPQGTQLLPRDAVPKPISAEAGRAGRRSRRAAAPRTPAGGRRKDART